MESSDTTPRSALLAPLAGAAILVVIAVGHVFADATPPDGWWAFVGSRILDRPLRALVFAVALLALVPTGNRALTKLAEKVWRRLASVRFLSPVAIGAAAALAWLLRARQMYGDGPLTIRILESGEWINFKEPLDRAFTWLVYDTTSKAFGWDPATAIALVSVLGGVLYLFAVRRLVGYERAAGRPTGTLAAVLVTPGYVQLFFGHVENYALLAAGVLWLLVLARETVVDPSRPLWPVGLVAGLTFAIHLSTAWLFLVPVVVVAYRVRDRARPLLKDLSWAVGLGLLPVAAAAALLIAGRGGLQGWTLAEFGGGDGKLLVPLWEITSPFERFTMFSWAHVKAVLNEYVLVAPAALVLLPLVPRARLGRTSVLLGAATLGTFAYVFLFNPDMQIAAEHVPGLFPGVLNEWDLFSLAGVPLCLWAGLAAGSPGATRRWDIRPAALLLALAHTALWIAFNARGMP